jgi:pimeloyl-ACP methyl ester carboxylesterase
VRPALVALLLVAVATACGQSADGGGLPRRGFRSVTIQSHPAFQDEVGHPTKAVVMAHGASTHKEQWLPLLPALADAGYDAVALDLGNDRAGAVRDAIAYVRQNGATTIVLMGSSLGCEDVLTAAAHGGYAAVVTFSAVSVHTAPVPVYAVASAHESVGPTVDIAQQIVHGSGPGSGVLVVPGGEHGVDMVQQHPGVIAQVVSWLRAHVH